MFFNPNLQNPSDYQEYLERGLYYFNQQDSQRAFYDFNQSIRLRPEVDLNTSAYLNRAFTLEDLGRVSDAINDYHRVIKSGVIPFIYYAYANLGAIYVENEEWKKAEAILSRGIPSVKHAQGDFKKKLCFMYYNYSVTLRNLDKLDLAIKALDEGIALDNTDIDFYILRSQLYARNEDYIQSIADADKALRIDSNNVIAHWLKGMAHHFIGQRASALQTLRKFVMLGGLATHPYPEEVKELINQLTLEVEPPNKRPSTSLSAENKLAIAEELMNKGDFDAAYAVLVTLSEASAPISDLKRRYLLSSRKTGLPGFLEEWIHENRSLLDPAKKFMIRDAKSYLANPYSQSIRDAILNELRLHRMTNNLNLAGCQLNGANFASIQCINSDFSRSVLDNSDFSGSDCMYSRFIGAEMESVKALSASFAEAKLTRVNLSNANLENANLKASELDRANLQGANLQGANLQWASLVYTNLENAILSASTVLPDGSYWNPGMDLSKYTVPESKSKIPSKLEPKPPAPQPVSASSKGRHDDDDYYDWQASMELDQWDPDSDDFVGGDDGTSDNDW